MILWIVGHWHMKPIELLYLIDETNYNPSCDYWGIAQQQHNDKV